MKKIIICDDEPHVLEGLRFLLRGPDREIIAFPRARPALERMAAEVPDLLITDVMMPEMSGLELVAELRKEPRTRDLPIIIVTARGQPRDAENAKRVWNAQVVAKPFDPRELKSVVAGILGQTCASA